MSEITRETAVNKEIGRLQRGYQSHEERLDKLETKSDQHDLFFAEIKADRKILKWILGIVTALALSVSASFINEWVKDKKPAQPIYSPYPYQPFYGQQSTGKNDEQN